MVKKQDGFTLVEIIVSLVLVGIIAAIAGLGIVTGIKGYLLTRENAHTAQKVRMALSRMSREFQELTDIVALDASSQPYVIYDTPNGRRAVAKDNDTVTMFFNLSSTQTTLPSDGDILIDNVDGATFTFLKKTGSWTLADTMDQLSVIVIDLSITHPEAAGGKMNFSALVHPRNTGYERSAPWS